MAEISRISVTKRPLGRRFGEKMKKYWVFYLFILPAIIWFAIFCYGPMYGLLLAFKDFIISANKYGKIIGVVI